MNQTWQEWSLGSPYSKSNPISPNSIQDTKNRQFVNEPKQLSLKLESDQMLKDIIRSS
jgi:hypothetical protein